MLSWRPFTETDWFAYAGAEPFPNGSPPLTADWSVGPLTMIAIVSGCGRVHVEAITDDGETAALLMWEDEAAQRALLQLEPTMTPTELRKLPGCIGPDGEELVDDGSSAARGAVAF